jgi:epoxyqueuosine reductase
LIGLFSWSDDDFRQHFRQTPLWRARRRGLLRNAALVLGNQRAHHAQEALRRGAADAEPLVRGACEWALSQLCSP